MSQLSDRKVRLFDAARRLPGDQRHAYLRGECQGDEALLLDLLELVSVFDQATDYLEQPAPGLRDAVEAGMLPGDLGDPPTGQGTPPEGPGARIGRYRLLHPLGEGGCGTVFLAEQDEPVRRQVALKLIKAGMDTKAVIARFEAERQALALMDHPNIARIFDAGATDSGRPFFVMELVHGTSITRFCDEHRLTTRQRLELFVPVCQAIQHAHQKGVIHRDIKPSNILISLHEGLAVPRVIDFGIAKATAGQITAPTSLTAFDQFIGTPAYMSPEQAGSSSPDVDTRSDIYSLGVLLYELLTGRTPFDPDDLRMLGLEAIRKTIREVEPPLPSRRLSSLEANQLTATAHSQGTAGPKLLGLVRGDLDWIVMKCLEKERTRRYETANGLAADLRRHLENEPVAARPTSRTYRISRAFRRNRMAFAAGSAVVAALLLGILFTTWQATAAIRARAQLSEANARLRLQIAETSRARTAAEDATRDKAQLLNEAEGSLQRSQIQRAEDLLTANEPSLAVSEFCRVLRQNPSNQVAATRLASTIPFAFRRELTPDFHHEGLVFCAQFSPDGSRVVTASADHTARLWDSRSGQPLAEPLCHDGRVDYAEFSPDGSRIVTASDDHSARVWHAGTGHPLTEPLRHGDAVVGAHFSSDGSLVVSASHDQTARVWNARSGEPLTDPLWHEGQVVSARFNHDASCVVTASMDRTARVWNTRSGELRMPPLLHEGIVTHAEFSPDGSRVVTGCSDGTARLWDADTGQPLTPALRHDMEVRFAGFSPNGETVVTTSLDRTARLWRVADGQPLAQPLWHNQMVSFASFSPDGRRIVTASRDHTARVWDAATGKPLSQPFRHLDCILGQARFSPDGRRVLTSSFGNSARLWDAGPGDPPLAPSLPKGKATIARFSPDGLSVLTGSADGTAQLWDARSGRPTSAVFRHPEQILFVQFSPDGLQLVTASADRTAQVWDVRTGKALGRPLAHRNVVSTAQFSPDGTRLLTTADGDATRVWNATTGQALSAFNESGGVLAAAFSPDGLRVVTGIKDRTASLWNAQTGERIGPPLLHGGAVVSVLFTADGLELVTASSNRRVHRWNLLTGEAVSEFPLEGRNDRNQHSALPLSPDGRQVVTTHENSARVWDTHTGEPTTDRLAHEAEVVSAEFNTNGQKVVTASIDGTARVWDARSGEPLTEPLRHPRGVILAHFSPDGQRLVTVSEDGIARVWEVFSAPPPTPAWFLDWAEARVGHRAGPSTSETEISVAETLRQRASVSARIDDSFYSRVAQWSETDPETRTLSAFTTPSVKEYAQQGLLGGYRPRSRQPIVLVHFTGETQ